MSAALPPLPDLIPISALRKGGKTPTVDNINNNCRVVRECAPCSSTQCSSEEVMGEQRSRRTGKQPAVDLIDTSRSRGSDVAAPQQASPAAETRKARNERHRKSDRRRDRDRRKRSSSSLKSCSPSSPERPANPRVNPIFVWVRQQDTHIVEVKCEDYDKRNRILLTKTAQGWRAIPRTETLAPALQKTDDTEKSKRKPKKRSNSKVKRKSTGVQVDDLEIQENPPSPSSWSETAAGNEPGISPEKSPLSEESSVNSNCTVSVSEPSAQVTNVPSDCHNKCDVSPLDNLLAVAELEFNQQIQEEQWQSKPEDYKEEEEEEQINNMEQLDMFIESCAPTQTTPDENLIEIKSKSDECECDYTEEDDNNLAMDDILSRLEQSLRSPDTLHSEINELMKTQKPEQTKPTEQETPTDLSTPKDKYEFNDLMPTDLTIPKSPHKRPQSQNSETIQSPQPSGIPAVPPSPDLYSANKSKTNIYLESLLSPLKETNSNEKEPLDLGKSRESDSPKVTCSQEVQNNTEPPSKKIKLEDITLKTLLDNESNKDNKTEKPQETPRLLELLTNESEPDPVTQFKQLLVNTSLNIPDPMLIPKDKLSQILSSPAREIPKLLTERPELRLPEALAFPHLLQDPDILVITLAQLETIVQKQSQSIPLVDNKSNEEAKKKAESPKPVSSSKSTTKDDSKSKKNARIAELSSDIDAATNAAFTQMMWLPYLNQLESAAMSFSNNPDFLKVISSMFPGYPGPLPDMAHMMGANRLPTFPPPTFPMQPPMNYNPLELSMWQEAMLQANLARSKSQFDMFSKDFRDIAGAKNNNLMFPGNKNPFLNVPNNQYNMNASSRSNLQIPQYNPHLTQKYGKSNSKPSSNGPSSKSYDFTKPNLYQQKLYENEKHLMQQRLNTQKQDLAAQKQHEVLKQQQQDILNQKQEALKQQELYNKQQELLKQQELFAQKPKVVCKAFANMSNNTQDNTSKRYQPGRVPGPIDLSGSTTASGSKLKVKQHLIDPANAARLLKHDDVPEVGSTTASIEEMQDAQKHLWHPLFGNQKSYTSPWNWTTVTATGE